MKKRNVRVFVPYLICRSKACNRKLPIILYIFFLYLMKCCYVISIIGSSDFLILIKLNLHSVLISLQGDVLRTYFLSFLTLMFFIYK